MPTDDNKIPQTGSNMPPIFIEDTPPPMMNIGEPNTVNNEQKKYDVVNPSPAPTTEPATGSAAPSDDVVVNGAMPDITGTTPKKKFAGGKIIATILGLFLLVGGVGAGVFLTQQDQNIAEKASANCQPGNCDGCGSPKKRQACRDQKMVVAGATTPSGARCTNENGCWISNTQETAATRCEILSMCKDTDCAREWESDCSDKGITTTTDTASCQNVKAYSSTWVELTAAQLSALKTGDVVNFCVTGTTTGGVFTKAMFTINEVLQAETTLQRPSSTDFCQTYTIPAGVTSFNVVGDIFHEVLGWR